ncbi:response regulator [Roseibium salinum]|nr:response regulator [Roseibium salinum]
MKKAIVKKLHEVGRHQIMVARSYAEAENCLDLPIGDPDLALVDLTLPDAPDGEIVDLCSERHIPTIVFTSRFDPKNPEQDAEQGRDRLRPERLPGSLNYVADLIRKLAHNPKIGVLVIDDAHVEREAISQIVAKHLYKVYQAGSTDEALQCLKENTDIKLVLADYFMPGKDGFAFLKAVRRQHKAEEVGVIGMSSYAKPEKPGAVSQIRRGGFRRQALPAGRTAAADFAEPRLHVPHRRAEQPGDAGRPDRALQPALPAGGSRQGGQVLADFGKTAGTGSPSSTWIPSRASTTSSATTSAMPC